MSTKNGKWIDVKDGGMPDEGELVLMECLQPLDGSILKKICYDLGLYVGPDGMLARYLTEYEEAERRQAEEAQRRQQEELARAKADAERKAREAEEARQAQERANQEATKPSRPTDDQIIEVLASHFGVHAVAVLVWLRAMDLESAANRAMEYAA